MTKTLLETMVRARVAEKCEKGYNQMSYCVSVKLVVQKGQ